MFTEFLNEIEQKEIKLSFSGGKIKYSGPEKYINNQLIENLKKYKGKIIKHFWPAECTNMMPINTEGTKTPFILLHGERMNYPLSEYFGASQPFYGFFHYGSEGEKIFHKNIESFARDYISQLQMILPTGPYYLAGFSFGGLVAFEMALQLQKQGFQVPVLILIDCKNPLSTEPLNSSNVLDSMFRRGYNLSKDLYYWFYHKTRIFYYEFVLSFKPNISHKNRNYYIMSTYMNIGKRYKPKNQYKGEILLFKSQQNLSVHEYLGWEGFCEHVELITIPGNHKTLYETRESYETLSKNIEVWLKKANDSAGK
jgi:thioesterase domain-containing protein